jgi:hypothetical protein
MGIITKMSALPIATGSYCRQDDFASEHRQLWPCSHYLFIQTNEIVSHDVSSKSNKNERSTCCRGHNFATAV